MTHVRHTSVFLAAAALVAAPCSAQMYSAEDTIPYASGIGTAERLVRPDRALVYLELSGYGPDLLQAASALASATSSVRSSLARSFPELELLTSGYRSGLDPQYPRYSGGSSSAPPNDRVASATYQVLIEDLAMLDDLLGLLSGSGVERISGVAFLHSQRHDIERDLIAEATRRAREDAGSMASALGLELGSPLLVASSPQYPQPNPIAYSGGVMTPQSQDLSIRVQVQGRWRLVR